MEINIFSIDGAQHLVNRILRLNENSYPDWGQMTVGQMLAHCADAFEEDIDKPSKIACWLIRLTRRKIVIGLVPYPKNLKTARAFIPRGDRDFNREKDRLIAGILKAQKKGGHFFHNKTHPIFGKLTVDEWNTYFVKHIDHHMRQFGV